jgi:hypothetical protein
MQALYANEAICDMGERHSYLNLEELKKRKNPEVV